jgi:chromosome condensin MukBEF complex kleisin-like MukF subunit
MSSAKYCISTRPTGSSETSVKVIFKCEGCNSELSSRQVLDGHKSKCIDFIRKTIHDEYSKQITSQEKIISEMKSHIKELESKLENIALKAVARPTSVVNTTDNRIQQVINNLIPVTDDHLKEQSRFLTLEHIKQGAVGYANFACEHALKDRVACTDISRRKIKYKNPEGQLVSDPEMMVMSKKLFTAISEKNKQLSDQYRGELINMMLAKYQECGDDMKDEETRELEKYIAEINKDMDNIVSVYTQARDIAEGQKPDMYHEFVREVCSKTVT